MASDFSIVIILINNQNIYKGEQKVKAKRPSGHMVMFLETDLDYAKKFDQSELSPIQKMVYEQLKENEQEKIREGYRTVVIDLESGERICEFNKDTYRPPQKALENLARALLPSIIEYYKDEKIKKSLKNGKRIKKKTNKIKIIQRAV